MLPIVIRFKPVMERYDSFLEQKTSHAMFSANIYSCHSLADNFLNLVYMLSATTIIGNAAFFIDLKAPIYNLPEHFFRLLMILLSADSPSSVATSLANFGVWHGYIRP